MPADRIAHVKAGGQEPVDIHVPASIEPLVTLLGTGSVRSVGLDGEGRIKYLEVETPERYYEIHFETPEGA